MPITSTGQKEIEKGQGTHPHFENLRVYLITDRKRIPGDDFLNAVESALQGGVRAIQLREKDLRPAALLELAKQVKELTEKYGAWFFINDRANIAKMAGAQGVHLTETSVSPKDITTGFPHLLKGASVHSLEGALKAEQKGADFITFSPIFETPSKKKFGPPQGLDRLREVARTVSIPVLALGGIKPNHVPEVLEHGAFGVAVISGIWDSKNIKQQAIEYMYHFGGTSS